MCKRVLPVVVISHLPQWLPGSTVWHQKTAAPNRYSATLGYTPPGHTHIKRALQVTVKQFHIHQLWSGAAWLGSLKFRFCCCQFLFGSIWHNMIYYSCMNIIQSVCIQSQLLGSVISQGKQTIWSVLLCVNACATCVCVCVYKTPMRWLEWVIASISSFSGIPGGLLKTVTHTHANTDVAVTGPTLCTVKTSHVIEVDVALSANSPTGFCFPSPLWSLISPSPLLASLCTSFSISVYFTCISSCSLPLSTHCGLECSSVRMLSPPHYFLIKPPENRSSNSPNGRDQTLSPSPVRLPHSCISSENRSAEGHPCK